MKIIYNLIIVDEELSYDNHAEEFNIGYFSSREKAENVAERYLAQVDGFNNHKCCYRISEKNIEDYINGMNPTRVFIISGWNENDESDETDIIESNCFVLRNNAEQKLAELKAGYERQEWSISQYTIDKCEWQEGFIRIGN